MNHNIETLIENISKDEAFTLIERLVAKLKNSDQEIKLKKVDLGQFSFAESQEILKQYQKSISDTILEERRQN